MSDIDTTARAVRECALSWEPDVRLLGNVKAIDIAALAQAYLDTSAELERLRAEVERLTRDRDRLAGYVRAARQLSRDAHTHLLEERPEETAQAIYRVICALASAEKEGDDR